MRIYYCIGLTNNLLKYLDKPEAVQICSNYDYLRGEALALRDYLHFEVIRIFAPDVKKNPEYKSIPYRKTFSPDIEPQLKVKEVDQEILIPVGGRRLLRGHFYEAEVTSAADYDLYGEVRTK